MARSADSRKKCKAKAVKKVEPKVSDSPRNISGHYDVLQIGRGAAPATIRRAYKHRALKNHPDKPGGQRELFERIVIAYENLSNINARETYDSLIALNSSSDGKHWSNEEPGRAVDGSSSEPCTQEGGDDTRAHSKLVAAKLWLRTFSIDQSEFDIAGLPAKDLMATVKLLSQVNQRLLASIQQRGSLKAKTFGRPTKYITQDSSAYCVGMYFNNLEISTYTVGLDLEQAVDFLGALTSMVAMARQRIAASAGAEPLTIEEFAHCLSLQYMPVAFRVEMRVRGKVAHSPRTNDLQLALSWWRSYSGGVWKHTKELAAKQARESRLTQQERAVAFEALLIERLESRVLEQGEEHAAMKKQLQDVTRRLQVLETDREQLKSIEDDPSVSPAAPQQALPMKRPAHHLEEAAASIGRRKRKPKENHAPTAESGEDAVGRKKRPKEDHAPTTPEPEDDAAGRRKRKPKEDHASTTPVMEGDAAVYSQIEKELVERFTPKIDPKYCLARVWGEGRGAQCLRRQCDGSEFCRQHQESDLTYGRMDGTIPKLMLKAFMRRAVERASIARGFH